MFDELEKLSRLAGENGRVQLLPAEIVSKDGGSDRYKIKLKSGRILRDVQGAADLEAGRAVTAACYPGNVRRYVIVADGFSGKRDIKEMAV